MNSTIENQVVSLENINPANLSELQGWKDKQVQLVKENPFIVVIDNKTYAEAKKRRTAFVTGRTTIEKQDKLIASKVKQFRTKVGEATKELVSISLPFEEKQQNEIKRYEDLKAQEKIAKEKAEAERIQAIKIEMDAFIKVWSDNISKLDFTGIEDFKMTEAIEAIDTSNFKEFESEFIDKTKILHDQFSQKMQQLQISENQRLENERLAKEREQFEKEKAEREAKDKIEAEKRKKEQDKINATNAKKEAELKEKADKIKAEQERLDKIEADRVSKIKAETKAKEDAKIKAEQEAENAKREKAEKLRIEALKPDLEKISKFLESLSFTIDKPEIKDEVLKDWLNQTILAQNISKKNAQEELLKLV